MNSVGRFPSGQREQTVNLPSQTSMVRIHPCPPFFAGMAELADALDSGSSESNFMQVQVLFPAPDWYNPNHIFLMGDGFGFLFISGIYHIESLCQQCRFDAGLLALVLFPVPVHRTFVQSGSQPNVTKLAPSEKVKIGTRTAHSATEQRLCAVFLKKGMTRKRIEKSAKKSYSKRINYATL